MKDFLCCEDQIKLLRSRGLIVENEEFALEILKTENYYNVINGYKDLFVCSNENSEECYKSGVTFEEIYSLYEFDRQIRSVFFQYILKVENMLRSLIAYEFSKVYGNDNYLKFSNFDTLTNDLSISSEMRKKQAKFIHELLTGVQSDIASSIDKRQYVNHYVIQYGFVPLWVLVNTISLGTLSKFYSLMKQKERIKVATYWNIKENELNQYIKTLAYFRNLCAHDERIYNADTGKIRAIPDTIYHEKLDIAKSNNQYICGKRDLYSLIIVLKILLKPADFSSLYNKIEGRMHSINSKILSINVFDVYNKMGFPEKWFKIIKS